MITHIVGNMTFESTSQFKYLGVIITQILINYQHKKIEDKEIESRMQKLFSRQILSRTLKLKMYKTLDRRKKLQEIEQKTLIVYSHIEKK